jgi:hypothetical protein
MINERIKKIIIEYEDGSRQICNEEEMIVIIGDNEKFTIETTSSVNEDVLLEFAKNIVEDIEDDRYLKEIRDKCKKNKQYPSYLKVVK